MIDLQRVALAISFEPDLPPIAPSLLRTVWPDVQENPELTLASLLGRIETSAFDRVQTRLDRMDHCRVALDRWATLGIRPLFFGETGYPTRWMDRLASRAPFVAFAWGEPEVLESPLLGVAGSRAATPMALQFAEDLGAEAAKLKMGVVSGAARGVDEAAMRGCATQGGVTVGIPVELTKAIQSRDWPRRSLLLSTFSPDAPFSVGLAMARNKLVYALAEASIVVQSDVGAGGTWTGAVECLKQGNVHLGVWSKGGPGFDALVAMGATPIDNPVNLAEWIAKKNSESLFD